MLVSNKTAKLHRVRQAWSNQKKIIKDYICIEAWLTSHWLFIEQSSHQPKKDKNNNQYYMASSKKIK